MLFVDFVQAFDTVPREMLLRVRVLARLGFPPKIANLVRLLHENVTLEVDLDDDGLGNTIIITARITSGSSKVTRSLRAGSLLVLHSGGIGLGDALSRPFPGPSSRLPASLGS